VKRLQVFSFFNKKWLFFHCFAEEYLEKSLKRLTLLDKTNYLRKVAVGKTGGAMFGKLREKVLQSLILD